jgi:hypothetical protein
LCEGALVFALLRFNPFEGPRSGEFVFEENGIAESDNILTMLQGFQSNQNPSTKPSTISSITE